MACQEYPKIDEIRKYFWPRSPQQRVLFERQEVNINYDIPRREFGDFYCVVCDAQMDTEVMWKNHVRGNRHFWNSQEYAYSDEAPFIQREMDRVTRPIVGLDYICEIKSSDEFAYQCLLCPSGLTTPHTLMMHILGLKHQMAFLKEHIKDKYYLIDSLSLTDHDLEPVVQNVISKYEQEHGRGKVYVKRVKIRPEYRYSTKHFLDDGIEKWPPHTKIPRYSPRSFRSPSKSYRIYEDLSDWKGIPFHERLRDRRYVDKPYSYTEARNIDTESTIYRREPTHLDIRDSRSKPGIFYGLDRSQFNERENRRNLRVAPEKRNYGKISKANKDVHVSSSSETSEYPDTLLRLINDATSEAFLKLALFKLDKIDIKEGLELNLLDRVANKATTLAQKFKRKVQSEETFVLTNPSPEIHNIEDTPSSVRHHKTRKTTAYEDVSRDSDPSVSKPSEISRKSISRRRLNYSNPDQNNSEISVIYDSGCDIRQSNSMPKQSSSSKTISIPGLTLTEE